MPPPPELKFIPRVVPPIYARYNSDNEPEAKALYVRRKFVLPDRPAGRHYRLVVNSISSEGTAYINGSKVGNVRGFSTPLIGDATDALRAGENELTIVVRDKRAITNPEYGNPQSPTESNVYLDAPGDCNAQFAMHGGVWLEIIPEVEVQGLKVDTSVRKGTVGAKFSVINRRSGALRLTVEVSVGDGSGTVLPMGIRELSLKSGEAKDLDVTQEWKNPKLWSWNEPNLYVISVELKEAETGRRIDLARARFGFRETWMQADTLFFNGHPVRLKGGGATLPFAGKGYSQLGRGAVAPDFCDEVGSLVTELVTGLINTPSKHNVERDAFWEATEANALNDLKRKWNHPSIIAWDLSNEWFTYAPYTGCDMNQAADRFMKLSGAVERLDPSRWTFFNGDYDIGGRHYNVSAHYMLGAARFGYEFDGHSVYLPDGAFLRPLDRDYRPGEEVLIDGHQNRKYRMGSKVLMDNENLWKVGDYMPPGTSQYMGEECVLAPFLDENAGPMIWMWKQDFDAHRDLNMAVLCNHDSKPGTITRGHLLQTFIMPDVVHHAFSGRTLTRRYSLLNDLFRPAAMSFRWRLVGPDGATVREGAAEREMAPAETWRSALSFTAPDVAARTRFTLQLRLHSEGEFVCGEDRDIDVWPSSAKATAGKPVAPVAVGPLSRKVFLFDPTGKTAAALKAASCAFVKLETLAAPKGEPGQAVVVIGEGALNAGSAKDVANLGAFADEGGRILILAQTVTPQGLPARVALESREWTSQPYVRLPNHPVLDGIDSWDLHFWAPERVSARGAYTKPAGSACIPLVDSGDRTGLEWVQMMELYRGRGNYLLTQFPLIAAFDEEPMARELLVRTLAYLDGAELYRTPVRALRLIAREKGETEALLKSLRVNVELVEPPPALDSAGPWMMEAGLAPGADALAGWRKSLEAGATLVVAGAGPADAAWLESLAGQPVRFTVPRYRMWEGRGYRDGFHPLTAGLSQLDLFWKKYFWNGHTSENPEYILEPFQNASVEMAGARELVFPGALVERQVGQGRLILDQRRWTTSSQDLAGLARRNLAALMLGLNVALAPASPKPELPPDVVWRPIDLSSVANRALYDEVAEDGRGGWSDQGPDSDFRAFPTGDQDFRGVPFVIGSGAKSIVVLASVNRPDKDRLPFEVSVPIGGRIAGLYFLHSAAYSGGEVAAYRIGYADGTTLDIPLVSEKNVRDWASHNTADFANEDDTETVVAWTGTCKIFKKISACMMLWVNPRPDEPVVSVGFVNRRQKCVPILIGMTAAVRRDPVEAAAHLARAREILKEARVKLEAQQPDEGRKLLREAVALSPELMEAHERLADLGERAGDEDELIATYRRWTRANPRTPGPWNRLGELLERRKDYKGALEAYNRSLKVEWNQPPVIEAKTRLEKMTDR
jgi:Tfp pilus assembly protein PilF